MDISSAPIFRSIQNWRRKRRLRDDGQRQQRECPAPSVGTTDGGQQRKDRRADGGEIPGGPRGQRHGESGTQQTDSVRALRTFLTRVGRGIVAAGLRHGGRRSEQSY